MNPQALTKTHSTVIAKSSGQRSYGLWINSDGSVHVEPSSLATSFADTGPGVVPLNTWTHVAAVITAGEGFKIYVNGVEQAITTSGSLPTLSATTAPVTIGNSDLAAYDWLFSGRIDEAGIVSRRCQRQKFKPSSMPVLKAKSCRIRMTRRGISALQEIPTEPGAMAGAHPWPVNSPRMSALVRIILQPGLQSWDGPISSFFPVISKNISNER